MSCLLHAAKKEWGICDVCGEKVSVPPGVYYRGERMHKGCYNWHKRVDYGDEVLEPLLDGIKDGIDEVMSNMGSMSEG